MTSYEGICGLQNNVQTKIISTVKPNVTPNENARKKMKNDQTVFISERILEKNLFFNDFCFEKLFAGHTEPFPRIWGAWSSG